MIPFDDRSWWRRAVVYQVYPRSFADSNNDGTGDVQGIIDRLAHLVSLNVDALWVSPWYPSPMDDGGYDVADYCDIAPEFGTLADADRLIAAAHERGIRVIIDLVPNHSSNQHRWFREALAAAPGSPERDRYIFRDGRGVNGDEPPTDWGSVFGGSAWERVIEPDGTPGQWYLHMFAPEQPDWNWENSEVVEEFDRVLRFWFDRGVDGFRIDVGDSMVVHPDYHEVPIDPVTGYGTIEKFEGHPLWDQPGLADIQRRWRCIADEYAASDLGPRVFVSEAYLPVDRLVRYVSAGRLHTSFNFEFLLSAWDAGSLKTVIDTSLDAHLAVAAPTTWVLNNHDVIRSVTRYGKPITGRTFRTEEDEDRDDPHWMEKLATEPTDVELGRRRARAAATLMFALPGGAYLYQGEELGLAEVEDIPEDLLQDPIWKRSHHTVRGRDGCRVPVPWSGTTPPFWFGRDAEPWLPQPAEWASLTVEAQQADPGSMLSLYRTLLAERHTNPALGEGDGTLTWEDAPAGVLSFRREPGFRCVVNLSDAEVDLPEGDLLVSSVPLTGRTLPVDAAAWLRA